MLTAAIGALAWGSNYGITPGTLALPPENVGTGKITVDAVGLLRYMGSRKADRA